jgi:hypothetical protein
MASHLFHEWIVSISNIKGVYPPFCFSYFNEGIVSYDFQGFRVYDYAQCVGISFGCFLNLLSAWVLLMSFEWCFLILELRYLICH